MLCCAESLSHVWFFVTLWTVACQAPLSMGFSRQEYWSGLPCLPPGDLPNPGITPRSPALQLDSLPTEPQGSPKKQAFKILKHVVSWDPHFSLNVEIQGVLRPCPSQQDIQLTRFLSHQPCSAFHCCTGYLGPSVLKFRALGSWGIWKRVVHSRQIHWERSTDLKHIWAAL